MTSQDEADLLIGGSNGLLEALARREEALKESEDRYRALVEWSPEAIAVHGGGKLLYANAAALKLFGATSAQELLSKPILNLVHPDFHQTVLERMKSVAGHDGTLPMIEEKFIKLDGTVIDVEVQASSITYNGARAVYVTARDITARKQLEDSLEENREKFRGLSEGAFEAIFISEKGRCLEQNKRAEEMFGYTAEEALGRLGTEWIVPEHRDLVMKNMMAGHELPYEATGLRKDGSTFPAVLRGKMMRFKGRTVRVTSMSDITERKQAEAALRASEVKFRTVADYTYDWEYWMAADGSLVYVSPSCERITGYKPEAFQQDPGLLARLVHPEDRSKFLRHQNDALNGVAKADCQTEDFRIHTRSGEERWIAHLCQDVFDQEGKPLGRRVSNRDITKRKQAEDALREAERLSRNLIEAIPDAIFFKDGKSRWLIVNEQAKRLFRLHDIPWHGKTEMELADLHPEFRAAHETCLADDEKAWEARELTLFSETVIGEDGRMHDFEVRKMPTFNEQGQRQALVIIGRDISERKNHEKQLVHLAHYDALTTLPNRVLLADRLRQDIAQAQRREQCLAVVYLDLDDFKPINDIHGHEVGDQLLVTMTSRMKQALRDGDTLARMGGDEFVAVLLDLPDAAASVPILTRLLAAAAQPVHVGDLVLRSSASLGVTFYPQAENVGAEQLLRQADQAMYQAKQAGKNRYHIFDAEQDRSVRGHHESLDRIRLALAEREFVMYYQPKVNMRTGAVIGTEALIRWQHPERGLLPPSEFLPVIEDDPMAIELGEWVIDTTLTQMALWHAAGLNIPVSTNVGARQLQQADFVERLRALLTAHPDFRPGDLELEVLETSALEDLARAAQVIEDCRQIGVMFALDDFGTGYSSLTYLKQLPVTQIKIDQSFVCGMLDHPDDLAILEGVIGLAAAFRRQVIAEGIESVEQGEMLLRLGCELGQGFGIARPMPAHELPGWSAVWRPDPAWINCRRASRDELPLIFAGVEHSAWIVALENHLKGACEVPPPLDQHQCRFGTWLDTEGLARLGAQPAFQAIKPLHRWVHAQATEMCELHAQGLNLEAQAKLGAIHGLRDALLEQLKAVVLEIDGR